MQAFVFFVILVLAFYFAVYRKWGYFGKFAFKSIWIVLTLLVTLLLIIGVVTYIPGVSEAQKESRVSSRLDNMNRKMNKGKYYDVTETMILDNNFEPEFDFIWERIGMYASYTQYCLFKRAAMNDEANEDYKAGLSKYESLLEKYCKEPVYKENASYAEYYLDKMAE